MTAGATQLHVTRANSYIMISFQSKIKQFFVVVNVVLVAQHGT